MLEIQTSTRGLLASPTQNVNELEQQICIFLRQANKFGIKIKINRRINVLQLMKIAQIEFNITMENQMIWVASKKYDVDDYIELELEPNTIVHVHDKKLQNCQQIILFFQEINKNGTISKPVQHKVSSEDKITDFILNNFNNKKLMLVESGRKLNLANTFKGEFISNGCTIYYEYEDTKTNDDEVQNDFNKLFQDEDEDKKQQIKKQSVDKVQVIKVQRRRRSNTRKNAYNQQFSSSEEMEMFELKPNFKKKKSICLKAVNTNPEDPNMCSWKRDFSQQSSMPQRKKLARVLKVNKAKKNEKKQQQKQSQQSDDSPRSQKMSLSQKVKLKNQFQKLFTSQNLGLRPVPKSKPSGLFETQRNQQQNPSKQKLQQNRNNQLF